MWCHRSQVDKHLLNVEIAVQLNTGADQPLHHRHALQLILVFLLKELYPGIAALLSTLPLACLLGQTDLFHGLFCCRGGAWYCCQFLWPCSTFFLCFYIRVHRRAWKWVARVLPCLSMERLPGQTVLPHVIPTSLLCCCSAATSLHSLLKFHLA